MDIIRGYFNPASPRHPSAVRLPHGSFMQLGWRAWKRLAAWRPVVAAETLIVLASLSFSFFYNDAFWRVLFG